MAEMVYRSEVVIERFAGSVRKARLPAEEREVVFGVHDEVAKHYGRAPGAFEPHATTLDYVVAATAG